MEPTPSISDLANAAEAALTQYNNDQSVVAMDQTKIAALQTQLAADSTVALNDGGTAYTAVQTLVGALQSVLTTLPQPAPVTSVVPAS